LKQKEKYPSFNGPDIPFTSLEYTQLKPC